MKMKKLLASALAAAMVISSMVGTLVTSAAETVGTITAATVEKTVGETDTIDVAIDIAFPNGVVAPHNIITVALEGYTLTNVALGDVTYTSTDLGVVEIDPDGSNYAAGKVLLEAPVDEMAPTVTAIALTATFVDADDVDTAAGTYEIVVNADDMTDVNESDIGITATNGSLVVKEAHVCDMQTKYDANGHWTECDCGVKTDVVPHVLGDAAEAEDGKWYQSCDCGYSVEVDAPVNEPVVDTNIKVQSASLTYGDSSLEFWFLIRNTVLSKYADMELVIIPEKYDLNTLNLEDPEEIVINKSQLVASGSTMKKYVYSDVYLYGLGLNVQYMLKAYDAEGNYVARSEIVTTSIAGYLKNAFATSSDSKFRTLITDTLIVGDEAAKNMAAQYTDSDLAKAPSILEGFDTSEATPSVDTYNTIDDHDAVDSNWGTDSSCTHRVRKSVTIGKVPYITYFIKDSKKVIDKEKLSFKVSYTKVLGDGSTQLFEETYNSSNTTFVGTATMPGFDFNKIGLQDSNANIVCEISYDGAVVATSTYSVETYLGSMLSDATIGNMCAAMIKLGVSFRAFSS